MVPSPSRTEILGSIQAAPRAVMSEKFATSRISVCGKGLHDPSFERDSCGFGLIANIDDSSSHWLVQTAISEGLRIAGGRVLVLYQYHLDGVLVIEFAFLWLRA